MRRREMRIEDVRELLDKRCRRAGGQRAFAREHGLSVQHISSVLRGKNKAPVGRLCDALDIEPSGMRWKRKG
jgi:hypothetical protein